MIANTFQLGVSLEEVKDQNEEPLELKTITLTVNQGLNLKATKALRAYVGGEAAEVEVSLSRVTKYRP